MRERYPECALCNAVQPCTVSSHTYAILKQKPNLISPITLTAMVNLTPENIVI
jgi:hypothetical protein